MGQWTLHTYKYKWQQHINILYFENTTVVLILPRTSSPSKGWAALNGPLSLSSASINDFQVSSNIFDLKNMKPWQHIYLPGVLFIISKQPVWVTLKLQQAVLLWALWKLFPCKILSDISKSQCVPLEHFVHTQPRCSLSQDSTVYQLEMIDARDDICLSNQLC